MAQRKTEGCVLWQLSFVRNPSPIFCTRILFLYRPLACQWRGRRKKTRTALAQTVEKPGLVTTPTEKGEISTTQDKKKRKGLGLNDKKRENMVISQWKTYTLWAHRCVSGQGGKTSACQWCDERTLWGWVSFICAEKSWQPRTLIKNYNEAAVISSLTQKPWKLKHTSYSCDKCFVKIKKERKKKISRWKGITLCL